MAKIVVSFSVFLIFCLLLRSGQALQCYKCSDSTDCAKPDLSRISTETQSLVGNSVLSCTKQIRGSVVTRGITFSLASADPCSAARSSGSECYYCKTDLCNSAYRTQGHLLVMIVPLLYFLTKM